MTERAVPFTLNGRGSLLRFDYPDIKALELALTTIYGREIGYPEFPHFIGIANAMELFLWRGLKEESRKGEIVHTFPMSIKGSEEAGQLLWAYLQNDEGGTLDRAIVEAFIAAGPWKRRGAEEQKTTPGEDAPKN